MSGGRDVEFVDYEKKSNTAFVIFKEVEGTLFFIFYFIQDFNKYNRLSKI